MMRLTPALAERGIDLEVLLPDEPGNAAERLRAGGAFVLTRSLHRARAGRNPIPNLVAGATFAPEVGGLVRLIRRRRVDVVILAGLVNPHAAVAARIANRAVVWQIVDSRSGRRTVEAAMPAVRRLSDVVMFWGSAVEDMHLRGKPLEVPSLLAHSPVDLARFSPHDGRRLEVRSNLGIPDDALVVGMVGNLNPQKGIEYFIRAAGEIGRARDDVWFVQIGADHGTHPAYLEQLTQERAATGLGDVRLRFVGGRSDLENWYPAFDVQIISSVPLSEGIPSVALEGLSCGVPIVATDAGSTREVVIDGETGFIVQPLNHSALAQRVLRLLDDTAMRRRLGANARAEAERRFGIESVAATHVQAFQMALDHASERERRQWASGRRG
jgi:glycosyltransferase involved in cell wall biosynthesis